MLLTKPNTRISWWCHGFLLTKHFLIKGFNFSLGSWKLLLNYFNTRFIPLKKREKKRRFMYRTALLPRIRVWYLCAMLRIISWNFYLMSESCNSAYMTKRKLHLINKNTLKITDLFHISYLFSFFFQMCIMFFFFPFFQRLAESLCHNG